MYDNMFPDAGIYKENKSDFLLGEIFGSTSTLREKLEKVKKPSDKIYSRNQGAQSWSRNFCTAVAPMCAILSYYGLEWTDTQRKEFWDYAVDTYGYRSDQGHYMSTGIDASRKFWNLKNPDQEVMSFKTTRDSGDYWSAIGKGFHAVVGYRGNSVWNRDAHDDGVLNKIDHGKETYGHIRRETIHNERYIKALDNYKGRIISGKERNDYYVLRDNMDQLHRVSDQTGYFPSSYFLLPLKEITNVPPRIFKYIMSKIRVNSLLRQMIDKDTSMSAQEKAMFQKRLHDENVRWRKQMGIE